jgi:hypothetical protein
LVLNFAPKARISKLSVLMAAYHIEEFDSFNDCVLLLFCYVKLFRLLIDINAQEVVFFLLQFVLRETVIDPLSGINVAFIVLQVS